MLNPKEQAKGGFRAHAEREQERRQARAEAKSDADATGISTDVSGTVDGQTAGARSLERTETAGERSASAPTTGRQLNRWR